MTGEIWAALILGGFGFAGALVAMLGKAINLLFLQSKETVTTVKGQLERTEAERDYWRLEALDCRQRERGEGQPT